jgi:hypothetical protein
MIRSGLSHRGPAGKEFPLLLVAAISEQPRYFEKSVADFEEFLGQIVIGGTRGYKELISAQSATLPPPVATTPPITAPSVPVTPTSEPASEPPKPSIEDATP